MPIYKSLGLTAYDDSEAHYVCVLTGVGCCRQQNPEGQKLAGLYVQIAEAGVLPVSDASTLITVLTVQRRAYLKCIIWQHCHPNIHLPPITIMAAQSCSAYELAQPAMAHCMYH